MTSEIIVALITAAGGVLAVMLTNANANRKMENQIKIAQAVTDVKIDELTREVRKHNEFAERMPVLEEQMKSANHRIEELEKKGA